MAPIPGPEAQLDEVRNLWGPAASDTLDKLLKEFDDLFMKYKADIGKCKIAKHPVVEVEPGAIPHREGARRMSPDKAERANQEVRDLLALGMIQPSLSPWASGIVMVKKKSAELRFCCDFRPLNEVTIKDAYPLSRIDESLSRLGKAKIYTSIDLAWAFWQIPVRKADRQKTAFACELGLFEWRRMPFGMCNASATFQRAIARALQRIVNREGSMVMAYIDDIVIATETIEDHMDRLREVFQCLREAGFKMRVSKCDFMKSEIKYLGRVVSADGIQPDPKAVTKLRGWDIPRTKTELQSFLGFANYYRDFIPWHAKLVAPLHAMTGTGSSFLWGEEQQRRQHQSGTNGSHRFGTTRHRRRNRARHRCQRRSNIRYSSPMAGTTRKPQITTNCVRKQKVDFYTSQVWSTETGNVRCILLHLEEPQLSLSPKIYIESR